MILLLIYRVFLIKDLILATYWTVEGTPEVAIAWCVPALCFLGLVRLQERALERV